MNQPDTSDAPLSVQEAAKELHYAQFGRVLTQEYIAEIIARVAVPEVERLVRGIVAAGDALVERDLDEAYHQLYEALRDVGYSDMPAGTFDSARRALAASGKEDGHGTR